MGCMTSCGTYLLLLSCACALAAVTLGEDTQVDKRQWAKSRQNIAWGKRAWDKADKSSRLWGKRAEADDKRAWKGGGVRTWGKRADDLDDDLEKRAWKDNNMRMWGKRAWENNKMRVWGKRSGEGHPWDKRAWKNNKMRVWGKRFMRDDVRSDDDKRSWQSYLDR